MPFAENLNYCMQARGYSAYRLAKIIGVSNQSVLNWQHGGHIPHTKTRVKIAEHFGITLEELDGDELPDLSLPKSAKKPAASEGDGLAEERKQIYDLIMQMDERDFVLFKKLVLAFGER